MEIVEVSRLDLDIVEVATVASFKNLLKKNYPQLKGIES